MMALRPYMKLNEFIQQELHIINSQTLTDAYTGFAGYNVLASAVIKNDYDWKEEGTINTALTGAVTEIIATLETGAYLNAQGELALINDADETETIEYTEFDNVDNVYTFTVDATLEHDYDANDDITLADIPFAKATEIDMSQQTTGVFTISIDAESRRLHDEIYGKSGLTGCYLEIQFKDDDGHIIDSLEYPVDFYNLRNNNLPAPDPITPSLYRTAEDQDAIDNGKLDRTEGAVEHSIATFDADRQLSSSPITIDINGRIITTTGTGEKIAMWFVIENDAPTLKYDFV